MYIKQPLWVHNFRQNWKKKPLYGTLFALLVMIILQTLALGFKYPSFDAWFSAWTVNWINILRNNASIGIVSLGMTFVILSGGIDLAAGSTLVAVGAFLMALIDSGANGWLMSLGISGVPAYLIAIVLAIGLGAILGAGTGVIITKGKLPPFIATLGTMKILRSVTQHLTQGANPRVPSGFLAIANQRIAGQMILPILYWAVIAIVLHQITRKTSWGIHVYAVGSNERMARLSGIRTQRVKIGVYTLMSAIVAVAAIIQVSRIGSMDYANAGSGYEMDAIASVIVGGTSMTGGRGTIPGTVVGTLIIAVMNNLLNLMGVPPFLREAFKGFIVIMAVLLQNRESSS